MSSSRTGSKVSQEGVVIVIAVIIFAVFALTQPSFRTPDNIISLIQNVSILGILGVAMALTIIGRGIERSLVCRKGRIVQEFTAGAADEKTSCTRRFTNVSVSTNLRKYL